MIRTNWHAAWCQPVRSSVADGETRPHRVFARSQSNIMQVLMMPLSAREFLHRRFIAAGSARQQRSCAAGCETPHRNTITSYKDAAGGYCAGIVMHCVRALQSNSCTHRRFTEAESADGRCAHANRARQMSRRNIARSGDCGRLNSRARRPMVIW
jgi:hypothetical protein